MSFTLLVPEYNSYIYTSSYILNRGWIDKTERRLPTYKEITGKDKGKAKAILDDDMSENETDDEKGDNNNEFIDDEDEFDDVADYFESTYNFRYEEPYVYWPYYQFVSPFLRTNSQRSHRDCSPPSKYRVACSETRFES